MTWISEFRRRARRRRARRVLLGALASVGAVALLGLCFPVEHVRIGRAVVSRSPETVWGVLTDLDGLPLWRTDLTAVQRLPDLAGRPAWREVGQDGSRTLELSWVEPPRQLVMQRTVGGRPGLPIRTFDLATSAGGTLVVVTERVEIRNPLERVFVRLGIPGSGIDRLLRDLEQRMQISRRHVTAAGD